MTTTALMSGALKVLTRDGCRNVYEEGETVPV
jgi:hypothetical protein